MITEIEKDMFGDRPTPADQHATHTVHAATLAGALAQVSGPVLGWRRHPYRPSPFAAGSTAMLRTHPVYAATAERLAAERDRIPEVCGQVEIDTYRWTIRCMVPRAT